MNAHKTDPTQRWAFPHPLPLTPLDPPFLHISSETLCVQHWVEHPHPHLYLHSSFLFPVYVLLFSFTALFSKLGCTNTSEGYWEIALKWFIIWLTFTTCMHFCASMCKSERSQERGEVGSEACKFLVLISQLALNQGSKVGLEQQLWQDKHLFLRW